MVLPSAEKLAAPSSNSELTGASRQTGFSHFPNWFSEVIQKSLSGTR
jgi:hypothetical protein